MTNLKSSIIIYGNPEVIKVYRESKSVNQSMLKKFLSSDIVKEKELDSLYFSEKSHFIIGDAVDLLLTIGNMGFLKKFYISDIPKPSDKIVSIMHMLYDNLVKSETTEISTEIQVYQGSLLDAIKEHKYREEWSNTARVNNVSSYGAEYFKLLVQSAGKIIISKKENAKILSVTDKFKKDSKYGFMFNPKLLSKMKDKHYTVIHQTPVYWNEIISDITIGCKGLIDTILVDHDKKTIKPFDIKSTGDVLLMFPKSIRIFRYDIQLAFYWNGLKKSLKDNPNYLGFDASDYEVELPSLLVASTITNEDVIEFELSEALLTIATYGKKASVSNGVRIPFRFGYISALHAYLFYKEHGFDNNIFSVLNNRKLIISEYYDY